MLNNSYKIIFLSTGLVQDLGNAEGLDQEVETGGVETVTFVDQDVAEAGIGVAEAETDIAAVGVVTGQGEIVVVIERETEWIEIGGIVTDGAGSVEIVIGGAEREIVTGGAENEETVETGAGAGTGVGTEGVVTKTGIVEIEAEIEMKRKIAAAETGTVRIERKTRREVPQETGAMMSIGQENEKRMMMGMRVMVVGTKGPLKKKTEEIKRMEKVSTGLSPPKNPGAEVAAKIGMERMVLEVGVEAEVLVVAGATVGHHHPSKTGGPQTGRSKFFV